jgi:hypothetical protein
MNEFEKDNKIDMKIFYIISFIFISIFLYYGIKVSISYGFQIAFFIWCTTVCTTPISSASILVSFPLKVFAQVPMFITKTITSVFSFLVVIYYYKYKREIINTIPLGKVVIKIIKSRIFSIFIIATLSSILSSYLLNHIVDVHLFKINEPIQNIVLFALFCLFLILNYIYVKLLFNNNIIGFENKHYLL